MPTVPQSLAGTQLLTWTGDLNQRMLVGLHRYFDRLASASIQSRPLHWQRDLSSPQDYIRSIQANRERFSRLIGLADQRSPVTMCQSNQVGEAACVAETRAYTVHSVRWTVFEDLDAEGLLCLPKGPAFARVVALPDADHTPEQLLGILPGIASGSQFARRLAELGCLVVVPVLVNRASDFSCSPAFGKTNQPHREWIYRQAFEMGRHIVGMEVQKVLAAVDWLARQAGTGTIGVAGYGEGGLLAFYAAALDERITAALISGYFGRREDLWREPIYRNIWGLLVEFGDAEIATLIAPRTLVIEYAPEPLVDYSPTLNVYGVNGAVAAPGKLVTPDFNQVQKEFERIGALVGDKLQQRHLIFAQDGAAIAFGSETALARFVHGLGKTFIPPDQGETPTVFQEHFDLEERQERQFRQMERFLQRLVRESDKIREEFFLSCVSHRSPDAFYKDAKQYRRYLWEELIGRLEDPQAEINPRTRLVYDRELWQGYEVVLDVWNEVFAWGILCIPKDLRPGERRPVVVCQHGYEGLPQDTIEDTEDGLRYYRRFTARLAERGFITFAPHNPYRGVYHYKQLQRKANPLKASIGSVILAQHTQILHWLGSLSFVDAARIAFYGLSYGGWTAVRIPPILEGYCLSICSANFNDWIRKVTSVTFNNSYMGDASFEMCEWDAGNTFSNAEMAYLMIPRPFMVERGMHDIVAPDAWVASEYAKVRWLYTQLGIAERTEIEFFNGEHVINGQRSFDFLHEFLEWPRRDTRSHLD